MSMNQSKEPDFGKFLEKLFDYISLCIYRYCSTAIYSSEMVILKKRLDNLEELEKKVSAENGDYIYPDFYIPVNQAYEIPVYARLSLAFFPFFFCF